ncbi:ABC transporter substrate-binding protein [Ruegeria sp. HKCCD8929]|uniref:ABC transporter substrate-binding protein n=1 Tax=Ruegeria sp. HKCCD8929 TaxID=2683006 RepID=UPI001488902E|nr:extracellular solute-binding protein [Ruegeria sp. HKCCD8929]
MKTTNPKLKGLRASLLSCTMALPLLGMASIAHASNCEGSSFNSPALPDTAGVVKVVAEDVTDTDFVKALIPAFNEIYPNITIEIEGAAYDVIRDRQIASLQRSEGTQNLMQVDTSWVAEYDEANFLEDLRPAINCLGADYNYDDFAESFRLIGQVEDRVLGVPFYSYPTGFVYRTDLWDTPPNTLEELVEGAIARHSDEVAGLALQQKQGFVIMEEWNAYLLSAGGQLRQADGTWTIDSPEARTALEAYINVSKNAAPEASLNWGFDETIRAASSGQASALSTYGWVVPIVNAEGTETEGMFALAPFPGGRGTGGTWSWSIPVNGSDKDAVWAWISWLTAPEQDKARTIPGGAPVRDSVMNDPEVWEAGVSKEYYQTYSEVAAASVPMCLGTGCAEAIEAVGVEINAAVAGLKSVDEALADAQKAAERATR